MPNLGKSVFRSQHRELLSSGRGHACSDFDTSALQCLCKVAAGAKQVRSLDPDL